MAVIPAAFAVVVAAFCVESATVSVRIDGDAGGDGDRYRRHRSRHAATRKF